MSTDKKTRSSRLVRFRGGELAYLPKRAWLTLRYQGVGTFLWRLLTFPLRLTPWGARFRAGLAHSGEPRAADRWYRRNGRPVTVVVPTYGDAQVALDAVASVRRTTKGKRVCIVV